MGKVINKKKGKPEGKGGDKIGFKNVGIDSLDKEEEIVEKYTVGPNEEVGENIHSRHPNRNLNKPDIYKPPYG